MKKAQEKLLCLRKFCYIGLNQNEKLLVFKRPVKKMKRQSIVQEKIFAKHIPDKNQNRTLTSQ